MKLEFRTKLVDHSYAKKLSAFALMLYITLPVTCITIMLSYVEKSWTPTIGGLMLYLFAQAIVDHRYKKYITSVDQNAITFTPNRLKIDNITYDLKQCSSIKPGKNWYHDSFSFLDTLRILIGMKKHNTIEIEFNGISETYEFFISQLDDIETLKAIIRKWRELGYSVEKSN